MTSHTVSITKDGNSRTFSFNTADKAARFASKMRAQGFETNTTERDTAELLRAMFPHRFEN